MLLAAATSSARCAVFRSDSSEVSLFAANPHPLPTSTRTPMARSIGRSERLDLAIANAHVLLMRRRPANVGIAQPGTIEGGENVLQLRARGLHRGGGL